MTRAEAAQALGLPASASGEEIEAAYRAKHNDLQQRILQAPVEGLKTKYREELRRVEQAREVLRQGCPANPDDLPALRPAYEPAASPPAPKPPAAATKRRQRPSSAGSEPRGPVEPREGGAGKYIALATLVLVAGAGFLYLIEAGPLEGWWQETLRDKDQVAEIRSIAGEIENLENDWGGLFAELGGAEPAGVGKARHFAQRGSEHLSRKEDELAQAAYDNSRDLWADVVTEGREELSRRRTEILDEALSTRERSKVLMERLKQAEQRIVDGIRDAKARMRSLEGRSGNDSNELRRASGELDYWLEYEEFSRRQVFEGEGSESIIGLLSRGESQVGREEGAEALASFAAALEEGERLFDALGKLEASFRDGLDTLRVNLLDLAEAETALRLARERAAPGDRSCFTAAEKQLSRMRQHVKLRQWAEFRALLGSHADAVRLAATTAGNRAREREENARRQALFARLRETNGETASLFSVGHALEYGRNGLRIDYGEAMKWYRQAADRGSAAAMNNIGCLYDAGRGVSRDYTEAMKWYRQAADGGDAMAMSNIGAFYRYGKGVKQDYGEALKWFRKAADKGHSNAMLHIGDLYKNGNGVKKDLAEAERWYSKAAEAGGSR